MSSVAARQLSPLDRVLVEVQRALETTLGDPPASRPCPARAGDPVLPRAERRHAAGLMRINHVGEVCAQGLYFGQAAVARDPATRQHLLDAAQEETDHLAWCAQRLRELDSRPSLFNPLWYAGSYAIGSLAGLRVLCVDNDREILDGMRILLARWQAVAIPAATVDEALERMADSAPQAMLVDYHLHDRMDGLDALDALRAAGGAIPGALLTADGRDELKRQARLRGYRLLTKPVKPASLSAWLAAQVPAAARAGA